MKYVTACAIAIAAAGFGFVSCSDDDDLPAIDGYNNSNEVGSANLVAHWTFDTNNNEVISNTAPAKTYGTVATTTGPLGNALQLSSGALVFPSITKIGEASSLGNFTVSLWTNVKNNGADFTTLFGIFPTANTAPWGNLSASLETGWFPARADGDTLVIKANYLSLNSDGSENGQDNRNDPRGKPPVGVFKSSGQWFHYVIRFTASTHKLEIFANGTSIGAYNDRGANTVALNMRTPAQAVIGSLATKAVGFAGVTDEWPKMATASIDDIRVFNTSLADKDVTALFNLGTAGR